MNFRILLILNHVCHCNTNINIQYKFNISNTIQIYMVGNGKFLKFRSADCWKMYFSWIFF